MEMTHIKGKEEREKRDTKDSKRENSKKNNREIHVTYHTWIDKKTLEVCVLVQISHCGMWININPWHKLIVTRVLLSILNHKI